MRSDEVLARRRCVDAYYLPSEADFLMILTLHNVIEKGEIQDKHYPQIRRLAGSIDRRTLSEALAGYETNEVLLSILDDLDAFRSDRGRVERSRRELLRTMRRGVSSSKRHVIRRRLMGWWRRRGPRPRAPVYALLGVDGSGKSSLNDELLDLLNHRSPFAATSIYMGPWGHYQLKWTGGEAHVPGWSITTREWLRGLFRRGRRESPRWGALLRVTFKMLRARPLDSTEQSVHQTIRDGSRVYLTLRYLRSLLAASRFFVMLAAEMSYRYWQVYLHRRRGTIVITDRYIYDLMTGRMHQIVPHYRRIRQLMCRLFFRPTRVFLLKNTRETILARSKDLSEEVLEQFEAVYDRLATEYGFETVWTDEPAEELARRLIERHFDEMLAMLRT
jgi:thymidylate kinase